MITAILDGCSLRTKNHVICSSTTSRGGGPLKEIYQSFVKKRNGRDVTICLAMLSERMYIGRWILRGSTEPLVG